MVKITKIRLCNFCKASVEFPKEMGYLQRRVYCWESQNKGECKSHSGLTVSACVLATLSHEVVSGLRRVPYL